MSQIPEITLSQIYYIVHPLLLRAGQILVSRQKDMSGLSLKARLDRVQAIETEIRAFMADTLQQLFTNYAIAPEQPVGGEPPAWQWVINPLDGGRYYLGGLPLFTTSLALRKEGEIVVGLVVEPGTQTVYHAIKGEGAFRNGKPIHVSDATDLDGSCVYLDMPKGKLSAADLKRQVSLRTDLTKEGVRVHDLGVGTLGLCYMATGAYDAYVGFREDPSTLQKLAPALVITKEAGATLTDGTGKPLRGTSSWQTIMVATPALAKTLVKQVGE